MGFFLSSPAAALDSSFSLSSSFLSPSSDAASLLASSPSSPSSSSDLSSESLSGAPNGLAGLSLLNVSPGLPKLVSRDPDRALPPRALAKGLDLNTDPPPCPLRLANGEAPEAEPKLSFGGDAGVAGLEPPRTLPSEEEDPEAEPNKPGFPDAPRAPNGDVDELASFAKPELAKAAADVCGFSVCVVGAVSVDPFACEGSSMLDLGDVLADSGS